MITKVFTKFVDDHESFHEDVEKMMSMMMKVFTKFVGVCRESAIMLKGDSARIGCEIKK